MYAIHSKNSLKFQKKAQGPKGSCTEKVNHIKVNKNRNPYIALRFKGIVNIKNNKILVIWHSVAQGTVMRYTNSDM